MKEERHEPDRHFGIGIVNAKNDQNIGTLWRSAYTLGASFIFTINRRYKSQATDVHNTWTKIPLFHFQSFADFKESLPYGCQLVGIEMTDDAVALKDFRHPERAVYLLGAEDHGLSGEAIAACHKIVKLPGKDSLNVSTAGSIVLYDRTVQFGDET
mgnify:CR=1 FL=1